MRIVFVHGMRQEGKNPEELRGVWSDALDRAWTAAGMARPAYEVALPFYGDELERLTLELRGGTRPVTAKGAGDAGSFSPLEEAILREMAADAAVTDAEVREELAQEVVAKGPANWEWVQGIARRLERRVPMFGRVGLGFVRQVDAYLTRPHIRKAVDALVEPALAASPDIVVAHSLGTVVTYRLLQKLGAAAGVKLLMTFGSPLGIHAVQAWLKPPGLGIPGGVRRWINGTDERDYVALHATLDAASFCDGIENWSDFTNRHEDAHAIDDYLADPRVARAIARATEG